MSFLGVDEAKAVSATSEKLNIKPADTLASILADAGSRLIAGKRLHAIVTVKGVQLDILVALEDKPNEG